MKHLLLVAALVALSSGCAASRRAWVPQGTTVRAQMAVQRPSFQALPQSGTPVRGAGYHPMQVGGVPGAYGYGQMPGMMIPPPPISDRVGTAADPRTHAAIMAWEAARRRQFTPPPPPIVHGDPVDTPACDDCPVTHRDLDAVADEVTRLDRLIRRR